MHQIVRISCSISFVLCVLAVNFLGMICDALYDMVEIG